MSQNDEVLNFLKQPHASLTHRAASAHLGCDRLAARVKDLRDARHNIHTEMFTTEGGARIARYTLLPKTA